MAKSNSDTKYDIRRSVIKDGVKYGVSVGSDKDGVFVHTHRARSKSYESTRAIPKSVLKKIERTG